MHYPAWKRVEDIVGAMVGLILFSPIFVIAAIAVKLECPREQIFVKLPRISGGKIIKVYKFRNMIPDADKMKEGLLHLNERKDGPFFKIKNDPRVTKVGRFLRKTRIDELPQLLNVLLGDLSLVGPRPHEPGEVESYPDQYKHIPLFRAGATGLSQISGASSLPFLKELELDSKYLKSLSFKDDLKILAKSAIILFFDPNAV